MDDVGKNEVIQEEINRSAHSGGKPRLTLMDVLVLNAGVRNCVIRFRRPDPVANTPSQPLAQRYS